MDAHVPTTKNTHKTNKKKQVEESDESDGSENDIAAFGKYGHNNESSPGGNDDDGDDDDDDASQAIPRQRQQQNQQHFRDLLNAAAADAKDDAGGGRGSPSSPPRPPLPGGRASGTTPAAASAAPGELAGTQEASGKGTTTADARSNADFRALLGKVSPPPTNAKSEQLTDNHGAGGTSRNLGAAGGAGSGPTQDGGARGGLGLGLEAGKKEQEKIAVKMKPTKLDSGFGSWEKNTKVRCRVVCWGK